jgi:hypothetical protein
MDYEWIKTAFLGINMLLTVGMWVSSSRDKKDTATIASLNRIEETFNTKIQAQDVRIARVEKDIDHTPTHDDLGKIYDKLNEMNHDLGNRISEITGEMKHLSNNLSRLYDNEMSKAK